MSNEEFEIRLKRGRITQEFFIKYIEKHYAIKFVAGDRYGDIFNREELERISNSRYIKPNSMGENHGPRLLFRNDFGENVVLTMPDQLFLNTRKNKHMWVEVKGTSLEGNISLCVPVDRFKEYLDIQKITKMSFYISFCVPAYEDERYGELIDIYIKNIEDLNRSKKLDMISGKYRWDVQECFDKLNNQAVQYNNYC